MILGSAASNRSRSKSAESRRSRSKSQASNKSRSRSPSKDGVQIHESRSNTPNLQIDDGGSDASSAGSEIGKKRKKKDMGDKPKRQKITDTDSEPEEQSMYCLLLDNFVSGPIWEHSKPKFRRLFKILILL